MLPSTPRSALALGLILVLAAGFVIALVAFLWTDDRPVRSPAPGRESLAPTEVRGGDPGTIPSVPEPPGAAASLLEERQPSLSRILCLRSTDLQPVPGISLFDGVEPLAGPTQEDGRLAVPESRRHTMTVWGEGWLPREIRSDAIPDRLLLVAADGSLEVRLLSVEPGHRVVRTLVQPHTRLAAGGGPWRVRLERLAPDRYSAERIPAGTYDVYFWVGLEGDEPRPFSTPGVEVGPGERATLSLDLSAPPAPEPDH